MCYRKSSITIQSCCVLCEILKVFFHPSLFWNLFNISQENISLNKSRALEELWKKTSRRDATYLFVYQNSQHETKSTRSFWNNSMHEFSENVLRSGAHQLPLSYITRTQILSAWVVFLQVNAAALIIPITHKYHTCPCAHTAPGLRNESKQTYS